MIIEVNGVSLYVEDHGDGTRNATCKTCPGPARSPHR
jgi:hypothetical protein